MTENEGSPERVPATPDPGSSSDDAGATVRSVRQLLLPGAAPRVAGYDVAAGTTIEEAGQGQTVWDWVTLPPGGPAVLAYQVVGGAMPPSHTLVAVRAVIRATVQGATDAGDTLAKANAALADAARPGAEPYVGCGWVAPGEDGIEWACAGRMFAGVIRRAGTFDELATHGPPLGMMAGFSYGSDSVEMGPGDNFLLLSNGSEGLFRGAADLVAEVQGKPAGEVVSVLHKAIRKAYGESAEETTVVLMRRH